MRPCLPWLACPAARSGTALPSDPKADCPSFSTHHSFFFPFLSPPLSFFSRSFFDRDVACVIRFFRKRFRYNVSREHCPKFSDYVSPDRALRRAGLQKREQEREREKGRESSARGEEDGREGASSQTRLHEKEEEEEDVMLDVITDASGLSGLVKGRQLEEVSCVAQPAWICFVFARCAD